MPRDKGWSIRPFFQVVAGVCLLLALVLDPGCQPHHEVKLTEATPIRDSHAVPAAIAAGAESGAADVGTMHATGTRVESASASNINNVPPPAVAAVASPTDGFEAMLKRDPLEALRQLHQEFAAADRSYTCVFTRQEMLSSGMGPEQDVSVKFRSEPYSVAMEFTRNPGLVKRALFVKGKWRDETADEEELKDQALVQPAGMAGLLIKSLKQPIRGPLARKTGRRAIDQFGFERAIDLLVKYCDQAKAEGALTLTYEGEADFKGRRVWVIKRMLPYTGPDSGYPDLVAMIYIDQEHHVPIAIHTFSDTKCDAEHLIGKYEYRDIDFNADITDADFEPATYGL
ncbi:MAG: DUF1571 domain-containing protein [Phycisphaerales bacterium]|nr:DUF1571 domain-containing protein [Phycisphaerales bacterium]MCB9863898.1 DUF1571 domain-containing protein [Phycisphaerales bacterium]